MKQALLLLVLGAAFITTESSMVEKLMHEPEFFSKGKDKDGIELLEVYETPVENTCENIWSNQF
jgi:hypothetical protein